MGVKFECPEFVTVQEFESSRQPYKNVTSFRSDFLEVSGRRRFKLTYDVVRGKRYILSLPSGTYDTVDFQLVKPSVAPKYPEVKIKEYPFRWGTAFESLSDPCQGVSYDDGFSSKFVLSFERISTPYPPCDYTLYVYASGVNNGLMSEHVMFRTAAFC